MESLYSCLFLAAGMVFFHIAKAGEPLLGVRLAAQDICAHLYASGSSPGLKASNDSNYGPCRELASQGGLRDASASY